MTADARCCENRAVDGGACRGGDGPVATGVDVRPAAGG